MSSYLTDDRIKTMFESLASELTDETNAGYSAAKGQDLGRRAYTRVDGYLMSRYVVPVAGPSPILDILSDAAATIWLFLAFKDRGIQKPAVSEDYASVIEWLKSVRDGKADLPGAIERAIPADASSTEDGGYIISASRPFTSNPT